MKKTRIAFIKFAGLSAGGTERWLQIMAANLPKDKYEVDYFYCDSAPYLGSEYKHANTNPDRVKYMLNHKINLIKFNVRFKDVTVPNHDWIDTDFWEKFDENKYDIIQSGKAGPSEYPFNKITHTPIIDSVHLLGVDKNKNIAWTCFLSEWSRREWSKVGGNFERSSVIHMPVELPATEKNLRKELNIKDEDIVAGYHQRPDNISASDIPLRAFSEIQQPNFHFIIMGGGDFYRKQAEELKLKNIHFLEADSDPIKISSFLNTLNVFAHGRKDGETFGTVLAEAMIHGLPCLSHRTKIANAQPETIGPGGFFAEDYDDYVTKLNVLFKNDELRRNMGKMGRNYAEKTYTLKQSIDALEYIYNKITKGNNSANIKRKPNVSVSKKISFKKRFMINIKIMIYNKYFFICRRFIARVYKRLTK